MLIQNARRISAAFFLLSIIAFFASENIPTKASTVSTSTFSAITAPSVKGASFPKNASVINKSTGPFYYNTYEYQLANNAYFPENRMKSTIDWLAENFKDYGFEYFTLDGWINTATRHTSNGYIMTHSDSWKHDLSYWAGYIHSKGLKFGFYYPPFWINKKVANDSKAIVEGTNIKISSIVNKNKTFQDWYFVDPDRKGARQYMEGFVKYMKKTGVDYLKVDFLMQYEYEMGSSKFAKTLKIVSDAADKYGVLVSLSAPNNHNHASVESLFGDMLRISQDVFAGGWSPFSSNGRGLKSSGWPEWYNAFDAFINYSDITGENRIALDGDFVIAHSFKTDAEARSAVSISIIAGAGLGMADTPENLGNRAWVFENKEILKLNEEGLIGKPLSRTPDSAANPNPLSQIWVGKVKNGDFIVALFNREDRTQKRSVVFKALGMTGDVSVRDLWKHKDLGLMTNYSEGMEPHGVTVLRISK